MANRKKKIEEEKEEVEEVQEEVEEIEVPSSSEDEDDEYVELTTEERIVNIEKKTNLILVLVAIVAALSLITMIVVINGSSTGKTEPETQEQEQGSSSSSSYSTEAFKEIRAQDIASESKNETIVVMIGRQGCGYCAYYAPIITQVAEQYGITVRYIDYLKIVTLTQTGGQITDQEAFNLIKNMDAVKEFEGAGETALKGTPATLIIKNSKILYYIKGAADANTIKEAFDKVGLGK
ncbi:MAG: thioredoxin family protein [Bacilli bacterium]|nr:thioredoxin family protein [Bacilli bacterium]